jgi:hypothetical protein
MWILVFFYTQWAKRSLNSLVIPAGLEGLPPYKIKKNNKSKNGI